MRIFNNKTEEEYEEERKVIRKINKPKDYINRRRKKEPYKPWTKKERFLIFFVLFFIIIISTLLALSAREWKLPNIPRLKFSFPSIFKEETIIIEKDKNINLKIIQDKSKKAVTDFKKETDSLSGIYGLYVIDLTSGFSFGINEKETFQAASLIKLPVMTTMLKEAEEGSLKLETDYPLKDSDKIAGSGSLYSSKAGTLISHERLLELMGKQSDNTAYGIVRKIVGDVKINKVIKEIGMNSTSLEKNETSPYDIGIFFKNLYEGDLLSKKNSQKILDYLTDTLFEDWIKAGIPENIQVAHKYGREIHVVNDAGIVYSDEPFILVILSKGVVESEADRIFPQLTKVVYDNLQE